MRWLSFKQILMQRPLRNFLRLSRLLPLFLLYLIMNIMNNILRKWIDLRENGGDKTVTWVAILSVILSKVVDLFKFNLVSLLSNDLEILENVFKV